MKTTLKEIKTANDNIDQFCKEFGCVLTVTNGKGLDKGIWTARLTRKAVQIFIVTGSSILDATLKASDRCSEKRK